MTNKMNREITILIKMILIKKKRRKKETNQILSNLGKVGYQRIVELTTTGRVGKGRGEGGRGRRTLAVSFFIRGMGGDRIVEDEAKSVTFFPAKLS